MLIQKTFYYISVLINHTILLYIIYKGFLGNICYYHMTLANINHK